MRSPEQKKRLVALILGAALVVAFAAFALSGDLGDPSLGDGEVAVVEEAPDGTITEEELQTGLEQAAFNLNLREIPPEDDPQFAQVQESAVSNAIQGRWVRGEAAERGITVTDRDIDAGARHDHQRAAGRPEGLRRSSSRTRRSTRRPSATWPS